MSGTLGKKNNFKVQYKILKSHRAHKTDCYFPLPCFYSTGFLTSQILLFIEDYCFLWIYTHLDLHPQVKTQKRKRTT